MQFFILVVLLVLAASVTDASRKMLTRSTSILSDEFIDEINQLNSTWKAGRNFDKSYSLKHLKDLMGSRQSKRHRPRMSVSWHPNTDDLPIEFDARKQWPNCSTIGQIRDQGACGSCWAHGAVEAMSDRICIHSGGKLDIELSADDLLSCCHSCGEGCDGGVSSLAWQHYLRNGIVTGGSYGSQKGCKPYKFEHCEHHTTGALKPCGEYGPTPECSDQCQAGYNVSYSQDKHYAKEVYLIPNDEEQIMREIMINGPIEATYTVYADFLHYHSGIYQQTSDQVIDYHAIRILGWGEENNVKYWLCANSWNTYWAGMGGFFKILRGVNECGIEDEGVAGIPAYSE